MIQYYAMIDGEQRGPFPLEQLAENGVRPSTYVWTKGMADWEKAEDVADICRMFRNRLHDLMHPTVPAVVTYGHGQNSSNNNIPSAYPSRFDRMLENPLPSVEEIDENKPVDIPPSATLPWAIIATFLFPLTGIFAIGFSMKAKKVWNLSRDVKNEKACNAMKREAHENERMAKMLTGISAFLGMIFYAFLLKQLI